MKKNNNAFSEGFNEAAIQIFYRISQLPAHEFNLQSVEIIVEELLRQQDNPLIPVYEGSPLF
jgi:hypothetical protein